MPDRTSVHVLNGPNLNLLGTREPAIYGRDTLATIEASLRGRAAAAGVDLVFRQSNHEGDLVGWIQEAGAAGAPGFAVLDVVTTGLAYTHTSVALHDAIRGAGATVVEVHLSNTHAREPFRQASTISPVAKGVIMGFGARSYALALDALLADLAAQESAPL